MNEINNNIEDNINDIIKAFEYFDIKKTGKIKIAELTKALSTFGDVMTEEEMFNIFREAGIKINTEEEIEYIKFINFWIGNDNELGDNVNKNADDVEGSIDLDNADNENDNFNNDNDTDDAK